MTKALVAIFERYASRIETKLAALLQKLSTTLSDRAAVHQATSISNQCSAGLQTLSDRLETFFSTMSPTTEIVLTISVTFICLLIFVRLAIGFARFYYGPDPILCMIPTPSQTYDPYDDEQADYFPDADVQPQLVSPDTPNSLQCISPSTGELLGHVPADTPSSVHEAVARARRAQAGWACTTFEQRRTVMRVLLTYVLYEQRTLCEISRQDSGKTLLDATLGEIVPTLEKLRWLIAEGEAALAPDARTTGPMTRHKNATVEYMPLGVIAAIAPWNYPMHNLFNPVIASLFAGNAVVVKPSEHTAFSSLYYARIIRRTLSLCGHSSDLVQTVVGAGDVGAALVDADVDKLFFTGSTKIGRMVAQAAAPKLLPVVLELGGKDPFIVCDDANVSHAASLCMRGVFQNSGQNCIGIERVFVHEKIMPEFRDHVVKHAKSIRLDVDMGAITMGEPALDAIQSLVDDAVEKGAKLLVGGKRATVNDKGYFYEATVLSGVTQKMRIAQEEVFGPVLSLFEWNNDQALVRMVNSSSFGLGSSVFSGDTRRANRILGGLRVGMGNVNDFATNYLCQSMPFGGTKQSGSDKFAGIEGLRGCCIAKAITRDRIPGVKTVLPKKFQYPTGANAYEFALEMSDLVYGAGKMSKMDNLRNMVGMLIFPSWRPRSTASG